jgi:hypothetical protein
MEGLTTRVILCRDATIFRTRPRKGTKSRAIAVRQALLQILRVRRPMSAPRFGTTVQLSRTAAQVCLGAIPISVTGAKADVIALIDYFRP